MAQPNMQRLADLGQLPKNYVANKLVQRNIENLKGIIKLLKEENASLKLKLGEESKEEETIDILK